MAVNQENDKIVNECETPVPEWGLDEEEPQTVSPVVQPSTASSENAILIPSVNNAPKKKPAAKLPREIWGILAAAGLNSESVKAYSEMAPAVLWKVVQAEQHHKNVTLCQALARRQLFFAATHHEAPTTKEIGISKTIQAILKAWGYLKSDTVHPITSGEYQTILSNGINPEIRTQLVALELMNVSWKVSNGDKKNTKKTSLPKKSVW